MPGRDGTLVQDERANVVRDLEIGQPINSEQCSETADGVARESEGRSRLSLLRPENSRGANAIGNKLARGALRGVHQKTKRACQSRAQTQGNLLMTYQKEAELRFKRKQKQLTDGQIAKTEYEQRAQAEREKMVRLRALRLARDAELTANPKKRSRKLVDRSEGV